MPYKRAYSRSVSRRPHKKTKVVYRSRPQSRYISNGRANYRRPTSQSAGRKLLSQSIYNRNNAYKKLDPTVLKLMIDKVKLLEEGHEAAKQEIIRLNNEVIPTALIAAEEARAKNFTAVNFMDSEPQEEIAVVNPAQ